MSDWEREERAARLEHARRLLARGAGRAAVAEALGMSRGAVDKIAERMRKEAA